MSVWCWSLFYLFPLVYSILLDLPLFLPGIHYSTHNLQIQLSTHPYMIVHTPILAKDLCSYSFFRQVVFSLTFYHLSADIIFIFTIASQVVFSVPSAGIIFIIFNLGSTYFKFIYSTPPIWNFSFGFSITIFQNSCVP